MIYVRLKKDVEVCKRVYGRNLYPNNDVWARYDDKLEEALRSDIDLEVRNQEEMNNKENELKNKAIRLINKQWKQVEIECKKCKDVEFLLLAKQIAIEDGNKPNIVKIIENRIKEL